MPECSDMPRSTLTTLAVITWTICGACTSGDHPHGGFLDAAAEARPAVHDAATDPGGLLHPDSGPRPLMWLRIDSPRYCASSVPSDTPLEFTMILWDSARLKDLEQAGQRLAQECVFESYPKQIAVPGKWFLSSFVQFTPDVPLTPGDYVVRFPAAGPDFRVSPRPYSVFRVGSVLRVTEIDLLAKKYGPPDLVELTILYSEPPPSPSTVTVEQSINGNWVAISASPKSSTAYSLAKPVDPALKVRVVVQSPTLDGLWTGSPGSGPAVVEFTPNEWQIETGQIQFYVEPTLTIDLPSGNKKP